MSSCLPPSVRLAAAVALLAACGGGDPMGGPGPGDAAAGDGAPVGGEDGAPPDAAPLDALPPAPDAPAFDAPPAGAPELTGIDFDLVPRGASFTVTGLDLDGATQVELGGVGQAAFTPVSDTALRVDAVDPATPLGSQELTVTTPLGTSAPLSVQVIQLSAAPAVLAHGGTGVIAADGFAGFVDGEVAVTVDGVGQPVAVSAPDSLVIGPVSDAAGSGLLPVAIVASGDAIAAIRVPVMHLVLSEVDSDTPADPADDSLELIELATGLSGAALDGYAVVLYDGGADASYAAFDLDGVVASAAGLVLLGNPDLSPAPVIQFAPGTLQNGPDAVALVQADAADFPPGTPIATAGLLDAVVYDTGDDDDPELLQLYGGGPQAVQVDEGEANAEVESVSRCGQARLDGQSYQVVPPTPGAANGCR